MSDEQQLQIDAADAEQMVAAILLRGVADNIEGGPEGVRYDVDVTVSEAGSNE